MHGLIFTGFRQYTWTHLADHAEAIWDGVPHSTITEAYRDEAFTELVCRTAVATGTTEREVLIDFGRFTGFWVFRVMRGDYYKESAGTRAFLLEGLVHGVADYYGERFQVEQPLCTHRGDPACSFVVTQANGG